MPRTRAQGFLFAAQSRSRRHLLNFVHAPVLRGASHAGTAVPIPWPVSPVINRQSLLPCLPRFRQAAPFGSGISGHVCLSLPAIHGRRWTDEYTHSSSRAHSGTFNDRSKADLKPMRDDVSGSDLSNEIENTCGRSCRNEKGSSEGVHTRFSHSPPFSGTCAPNDCCTGDRRSLRQNVGNS
jgi:hypothetical protein